VRDPHHEDPPTVDVDEDAVVPAPRAAQPDQLTGERLAQPDRISGRTTVRNSTTAVATSGGSRPG
jgi:hypothetical protein